MTWLVLLVAIAAGEPCKDCWNASCADLADVGLPACKAPRKKAASSSPACAPGMVKNGDTQGHCCWPGQSWNGMRRRCIGAPQCPTGFRADGESCAVAVTCPNGTTWNGSGCAPNIDKDATGIAWVQSQGVTIARTETTVAQYRRCVAAGACTAPDTHGAATWNGGKEDHPINNVDWEQATAFCRWAGGRLPTAAEWQQVASNGGSTAYPWGDSEPDGSRANFCDRNCKSIWKTEDDDDGFATTSPVCAFHLGHNRDGVCDLAGNVHEWTASGWNSGYKESRGGSWNNSPPNLRASNRSWNGPGLRVDSLGFRCAQ
jgi:hypothetical protein